MLTLMHAIINAVIELILKNIKENIFFHRRTSPVQWDLIPSSALFVKMTMFYLSMLDPV